MYAILFCIGNNACTYTTVTSGADLGPDPPTFSNCCMDYKYVGSLCLDTFIV